MNRTRPQHVALCVPSNREGEAQAFLKAWRPHLSRAATGPSPLQISLYIHEDHPQKSFSLSPDGTFRLVHTSHQEIESILGSRAWIIPRRSAASRSFPLLLAWKDQADFLITLDDDCHPLSDGDNDFLTTHVDAFRQDRWFRTIDGACPRGVPYGDCDTLPVLLNHGLWAGVPDLDGPTALVAKRYPQNAVLRARREVIPPGMWFPLCAMNVCYSRQAIPAAYNLLMGPDYGIDRFDDIWSGLFLKRIADHLGLYITNGIPFIWHRKASSLFANLRKEALGIQLHEGLWKHVRDCPLGSAKDVSEAYLLLAGWIREFPRRHQDMPVPDGYFEKLADAMTTWAQLFPAEHSRAPGRPSETRAP